MKKMIITMVFFINCCLGTVLGEELTLFGYSKTNGIYSYGDLDPTIGFCSYVEETQRPDRLGRTDLGIYSQVPLVKYDNFRINFGFVCPLSKPERTRPAFSVSYLWSDYFSLPDWVPFETGAYWSVSPYVSWGVQFGVINIKF